MKKPSRISPVEKFQGEWGFVFFPKIGEPIWRGGYKTRKLARIGQRIAKSQEVAA